ncbi:uncharacterized protein C8Q71DRAFT_766057 [Rhodofomes roseus]|uniref:BTB domain-containing protein n=1 Tax=Rhodofomes roseus TaxID=34475 RepID=A0ABQ8KCH4_9APHY|nr:uncharacterized protein C8Q71DRAFT_766057 [Rhodofomes roseus]KAH9834731.1 hypothetical protein C8Q71DRAFT_766057 [Rhodofomes roseus]
MNFRVRKAILAEASPFFETMFSLPNGAEQPAHSGGSEAPGLPVVPMSESSTVVDGLLLFCYPADRRLQEMSVNPDDLLGLLPAARKYTMDRMVEYIILMLHYLAEVVPLRIYCVAIHFQLGEDLIRAAARGFLNEPVAYPYTRVAELDLISGSAHARLLDYHSRCSLSVSNKVLTRSRYAITDPAWDDRCWHKCASERNTCNAEYFDSNGFRWIASWFSAFMQRCHTMVRQYPSRKGFESGASIVQALADAKKCDFCGPKALADVQTFLSLLTDSINEAISKISLEIVAWTGTGEWPSWRYIPQ